MDIIVTLHASKRALKRSGIKTDEEIIHLWRTGKQITAKQAYKLRVGYIDEPGRIIIINGRHVLVGKIEEGCLKIVTYIRKEKKRKRKPKGRFVYYHHGKKCYKKHRY